MRLHFSVLGLAVLAIAAVVIPTAARADVTLYSDGAPNGTYGAWAISSTNQVQDSFSLAAVSTLTSVTFGNWLETGDTAASVGWAIVTSEGTQTLACPTCSGTATIEHDDITFTTPSGFTGVNEVFALPNLDLSAGTYWLELDNEIVSNDDPAFWDNNGGPSGVWTSLLGDVSGANCSTHTQFAPGACSDSFTIIGNPDAVTATPEPSSLALLGSGLILLCVELRRRRNRRR